MAINGGQSVYERANKDAYDALTLAKGEVVPGQSLADVTTRIFPTILKRVSDSITRTDDTTRDYSRFKLPLSEYGVYVEYLSAKMIKAADSEREKETGDRVDDFVIMDPDIKGYYSGETISANYPLSIRKNLWKEAISGEDGPNIRQMSKLMALASRALYDGITHDHDSFIPALIGSFYAKVKESPKASSMIRTLPALGTNRQDYASDVRSVLSKAIRDMTKWRSSNYNLIGTDMADSLDDLVLVSFDSPVAKGRGETSLDVISSFLQFAPNMKASGLGSALGIEVYEMPSPGIVEADTARAYGLPNFPGMQTADMSAATYEDAPYPEVKYALMGKAALNVGLKYLDIDSGRSIRGHFDQTWVEPTLHLAFGAGQAIFFVQSDPVPATAINLIGPQANTLAPNETFQFAAIVSPDNATDKTVEWSIPSNPGNKSTITKTGLFTAGDYSEDTGVIVLARSTSQIHVTGQLFIQVKPPAGTTAKATSEVNAKTVSKTSKTE